MAKQLFTIGYSGYKEVDDFISELKDHDIQILIDVRSSPYSAYYEQYNKEPLSRKLKENGIYYFNYARQFGARQDNPAFYTEGTKRYLDFEKFAKSKQFLEGVHAVEKSKANIVFMCAEKYPSTCHRAILVARAFSDRGYKVLHIIPGEALQSQADIEQKLLVTYCGNRDQISLDELDEMDEALERDEKKDIDKAYQECNQKIGFKWEDLTA